MEHALSLTKRLLFLAALSYTFISCNSDNDNSHDAPNTILEQHGNSIDVKDMEWTYYSLETGQVVGSSAFGDSEAESRWKQRQDWDFAICGEMIRTNSGTSGIGHGGITTTDTPYEQLNEAPENTYKTDKVW